MTTNSRNGRSSGLGQFIYREFTRCSGGQGTGIQSHGGESSLQFVVPKQPIQPGSRAYKPVYEFEKSNHKPQSHFYYLRELQLVAAYVRQNQERKLRRRIRMRQFLNSLSFWGKVISGVMLATLFSAGYYLGLEEMIRIAFDPKPTIQEVMLTLRSF